jgi:FAD/FMN-containing dehydrogenase
MSKVAYYLQEHVVGEVTTAPDVRRFFSTDGSVFAVTPTAVVYPRQESDVRNTARFSWQLAERGRIIPLTARGLGTDQAGAAIGTGVIMVFPAHFNKVIEVDGKSGTVVVEPGVNYGKLQQTLQSHHRYLPPYPSSMEYSTIGGAIANNAAGEKSIKYGSTRNYVKSLRVVLANGEVIETGRLSKREVNKKQGLSTLEGEIYRAIDKLYEENTELLAKNPLAAVSKNSSGYDLWDVRRKDGSYDLTPLIVGSQGTLGIVTQATMSTEAYSTQTSLFAAFFDDLQVAEHVVLELNAMGEGPSAMEMVDEHLLRFVQKHQPNRLKSLVPDPLPKLVMLIEFDNANDRTQKRLVRRAQKVLNKYEVSYELERDADKQAELWQLRRSAAAVLTNGAGKVKAVPIIEDGIVPADKFEEYLKSVYALFAKHKLDVAVWGHAGNANLHLQPFLDLSEVGDRQMVFKLADEYYKLVIGLGGSTSGEHNDGRLRGPFLSELYGPEVYALFQRVKQIFDPYGILNPGVKIDVTTDLIKPLLRHEYDMSHLYAHLPHS